jgi:hypothetical protein
MFWRFQNKQIELKTFSKRKYRFICSFLGYNPNISPRIGPGMNNSPSNGLHGLENLTRSQLSPSQTAYIRAYAMT